MDEQRASGPPGERRLEQPPSERYRAAPQEPTPDGPRSTVRAIALAGLSTIVGAVAITLAGGILAITAGLLVIAAALGWVVAVTLSMGAGTGRRRRWLAAVVAAIGATLGQAGLWLVARQEGGTLGLLDYLGEVFGVLVPLQLLIAAAVAWWRAR